MILTTMILKGVMAETDVITTGEMVVMVERDAVVSAVVGLVIVIVGKDAAVCVEAEVDLVVTKDGEIMTGGMKGVSPVLVILDTVVIATIEVVAVVLVALRGSVRGSAA